jgi:L-amino acid N-acyltransferase YncA
MALELCPVTITDAKEFVAQVHRHHKPPQGGLFAVGVSEDGRIVGVAIIGRPIARLSNDGWTAEVIRIATTGARNACSMLYQAAWRAARALGYKRLITYTLPEEGGGSWSRVSRPRVDHAPTQIKMKWERSA